jgi:hypothetical protein
VPGDSLEKVRQVRDIMGDGFGEGFVVAMLNAMDESVERVIGALLEGNVPPSLGSMNRTAPLHNSPDDRFTNMDTECKVCLHSQRVRRQVFSSFYKFVFKISYLTHTHGGINMQSHLFVPCGHVCVCSGCASKIMETTKKCPICCASATQVL